MRKRISSAERETPGDVLDGVFGEELAEGQVEGAGDLLQGFEGGNGVAVFDAREVAAEQARTLLDVPLGHALLETEAANRRADIDRRGRGFESGCRFGRQCCVHMCH